MPSEPTLFDDDGDASDGDAAKSAETAARGAGDPGAADGRDTAGRASRWARSGGPNYLVRRGVVVGGVVAVIATAAIVIGNLIGTGATDDVSGAIEADWNRVIRIDERSGLVIVHDENGDELERVESGVSRVTESAVVGPTAVLVGSDGAAVVDLDDGTATTVDHGGSIARPSGSAFTVVVTDTGGGRGLLVHTPTGQSIDTSEFAPLPGTRYQFDTARATPSGRAVLVTDSGNFQSVLFSFDREEPSFFPGLALAVTDDVVVTAQNVGADATVNVFDHDGEPISSGRTASVRAAIVDGDAVRLVTVDGQIVDLDVASGDTGDGERLDIGTITDGHVWTSGDRLVVVGADGTAIVADDGTVVASSTGATPADGGTLRRATCLVMQATATGSASGTTLVDVRDGTIVAETDADGTVLGSADGCTAVITASTGGTLLDSTGVRTIGLDAAITALSPDGVALGVTSGDRLLLVATDDVALEAIGDTDILPGRVGLDTVDLGPDDRTIAFTEL